MESRRAFLFRAGSLGAGFAVGLPTRANPGADVLAASEAEYVNHVTPEAQRAAERGLAFLAGTQNSDGSFGDSGAFRGNLAVTSLSAMALMAGGHQPGRGAYGNNVLRALQFVLTNEQKSPAGFLNNPSPQFRQGPMYSHGFATLFLAEVYGMVPDRALQDRLKGTIERAVQLIVNCQNSEGGWRYEPMKQ